MRMYALSLWEPWASLIIWGEKHYETRDWSPRGLRKGDRIVIHAAKRWQKSQAALCAVEPFKTVVSRHGIDPAVPKFPLGCALGIVEFGGYWRTEDLLLSGRLSEQERLFGNYEPERFGWYVKPVSIFEMPIPLKGQQGLFRVNLQ